MYKVFVNSVLWNFTELTFDCPMIEENIDLRNSSLNIDRKPSSKGLRTERNIPTRKSVIYYSSMESVTYIPSLGIYLSQNPYNYFVDSIFPRLSFLQYLMDHYSHMIAFQFTDNNKLTLIDKSWILFNNSTVVYTDYMEWESVGGDAGMKLTLNYADYYQYTDYSSAQTDVILYICPVSGAKLSNLSISFSSSSNLMYFFRLSTAQLWHEESGNYISSDSVISGFSILLAVAQSAFSIPFSIIQLVFSFFYNNSGYVSDLDDYIYSEEYYQANVYNTIQNGSHQMTVGIAPSFWLKIGNPDGSYINETYRRKTIELNVSYNSSNPFISVVPETCKYTINYKYEMRYKLDNDLYSFQIFTGSGGHTFLYIAPTGC